MCWAVVGEVENGDEAIGRGAGKVAAGFVWRPREQVHRGSVEGEGVVECPGGGGGVEAPDEDFAVVGGGGEDGAEFGVSLNRGGKVNWEVGGSGLSGPDCVESW